MYCLRLCIISIPPKKNVSSRFREPAREKKETTNNEEWMEEPDGVTGEKVYKISVVADDVRVSDRNMDRRGGTQYIQ